MIKLDRTILSIATITLALAAALVCSIWFLVDAGDDADRFASDTEMTRSLVQRIESKRPIGQTGASSAQLALQLPRLMDSALKTAEIDAESLVQISPQPARQMGESHLSEIPLELNFRQITLHQLLTFAIALTSENSGLSVRDLHLTYPVSAASAGPATDWDVELTISYFSNSPGTGTALAD